MATVLQRRRPQDFKTLQRIPRSLFDWERRGCKKWGKMLTAVVSRHSCLAFASALLLGLGCLHGQTPEQNLATFQGAASITNLSYHWDSMSGGIPQVATTPRTALSYAPSLSTINWDPVNFPQFYQQKVIGSTTYDCALVGTFTAPNSFWDAAPGTTKQLTYTSNSTTHYIFPYVTVGNDLRTYLTNTYFQTATVPDSAEVALRIQQSLGLPAAPAENRGLAFFWAPISHIARSGYSADVSQGMPALMTFSDGTYVPVDNAPSGFNYVDVKDNTILYTGANSTTSFVSFNQAQTTFPWTAMGYTYNWNWLQDGSNPSYGSDPLRATNPFGLTEFVVSGGSEVLLDSWIPYSSFGTWVVPEPGTVILMVLSASLILVVTCIRRIPCRAWAPGGTDSSGKA